MGIFDGIARALGSLSRLSDQELADEYEALRVRYVAGEVRLLPEMDRYNREITRRMNEAYASEHPEPQARVHREHGRYLPNDD
jgi:uncharacterized membrane-anchored protein YhcB (DUF1043 family)